MISHTYPVLSVDRYAGKSPQTEEGYSRTGLTLFRKKMTSTEPVSFGNGPDW